MSKSNTNNIQKAIDQIGYDTVERIVRPHGHLLYCDVHGYYAVQGVQEEDTEEGVSPATISLCPLCIKHNPKAEGVTASEVELVIDLRNQLQDRTKPIDITD